MEAIDHLTPTSPRRHRWYQFSLRTLLVLVTLAGFGCGWMAIKLDQARKQKAAVAALHKYGAMFTYDFQTEPKVQAGPASKPEPPAPQWLREWTGDDLFISVDTACLAGKWTDEEAFHLQSLSHLKRLILSYTRIGDEGLANIENLQQLENLSLGRTVTDTGLQHIAGLQSLRQLSLRKTKITDEGIHQLRRLTELRTLSLDGTQITGSTLDQLQTLPHLEELSLDGSAITDAGLEKLAGFSHLKTLKLTNTGVSPEAVEKLQRVLQECKIEKGN